MYTLSLSLSFPLSPVNCLKPLDSPPPQITCCHFQFTTLPHRVDNSLLICVCVCVCDDYYHMYSHYYVKILFCSSLSSLECINSAIASSSLQTACVCVCVCVCVWNTMNDIWVLGDLENAWWKFAWEARCHLQYTFLLYAYIRVSTILKDVGTSWIPLNGQCFQC